MSDRLREPHETGALWQAERWAREVDGRRSGREGTWVYLWPTFVYVWQKTTKFCKVIILQLKNWKKKRICHTTERFKHNSCLSSYVWDMQCTSRKRTWKPIEGHPNWADTILSLPISSLCTSGMLLLRNGDKNLIISETVPLRIEILFIKIKCTHFEKGFKHSNL